MSTVTPRLGLTKPIGTEQYAVSTLNNNSDLIDAYALNTADKMAKGLVSVKYTTTNPSVSVGPAVLENIASFAFKGGRKYRIVWEGPIKIDATSNYYFMQIGTCPTTDPAAQTTGITALDGATYTVNNVNASEHFRFEAIYEPGADTTLQVKFYATRSAGGGTMTLPGSSERIHQYIEDLGAQY